MPRREGRERRAGRRDGCVGQNNQRKIGAHVQSEFLGGYQRGLPRHVAPRHAVGGTTTARSHATSAKRTEPPPATQAAHIQNSDDLAVGYRAPGE